MSSTEGAAAVGAGGSARGGDNETDELPYRREGPICKYLGGLGQKLGSR
jgi:hypothetical protein